MAKTLELTDEGMLLLKVDGELTSKVNPRDCGSYDIEGISQNFLDYVNELKQN